MKIIDAIKNWFQNQKEISLAKSSALHDERLKTIKQEASIDNAIRLEAKKAKLARMKSQPRQTKTFKSPSFTTNSSSANAKSHKGNIIDMEF